MGVRIAKAAGVVNRESTVRAVRRFQTAWRAGRGKRAFADGGGMRAVRAVRCGFTFFYPETGAPPR